MNAANALIDRPMVKLIHTAASSLGLADDVYRQILKDRCEPRTEGRALQR